MDYTIFQQLGLATALGALIGLEREHKHQLEHALEKNEDTFGGIRTFALIGLAGALSFVLSSYSIVIFVVVSAALLTLVIASYIISSQKYGNLGITSEVASILVYMIGILCGMGLFLNATIVAFIVLMFLLLKTPLHKWAKNIRFQEILSTLEFMLIAFIVLPFLPNQNFGPYGFFNPYLIWLLVVFISGISFVSYVAIKLLGPKRGLTLTGFLSGFISTTALSVSISNQSKKNGKILSPYLLAITLAVAAMFLRMLFEVFILNQELAVATLVPMLSMSVAALCIGLFLMWKGKGSDNVLSQHIVDIKSPFSLLPALKFGLLFTILLFIIKFGIAKIGENGIYLASTIFGSFDVDVVTVSMSSLLKNGEVAKHAAVMAITIAGMVNTLLKIGIFFLFADRKLAKMVSLMVILVALVGGLSLFFV
ncbi:MgtC/SapB family protein [Candidatus Peregrinibacteria bacterium]|nr:MgtC/SapB family protein [Candidatus Peregrinibacteria bacterium]